MSVINTNYLALVSQNNLTKSQGALGQAIERLSSGLRINSAKDDAAGQAIANRFTANIKGLTQASRNANDGISIAQTTEGALNEINNNLQRIRELSVQAANGSNSPTDLESIQAEITQRLDEIDRVSKQTQFNGQKVLSAEAGGLNVQVGAHDGETIQINLREISSTTLGLGNLNVQNKALDTTELSQATLVGGNVTGTGGAVTLTDGDVTAVKNASVTTVGKDVSVTITSVTDTNSAPAFVLYVDEDDSSLHVSNDNGTTFYSATYDSASNSLNFNSGGATSTPTTAVIASGKDVLVDAGTGTYMPADNIVGRNDSNVALAAKAHLDSDGTLFVEIGAGSGNYRAATLDHDNGVVTYNSGDGAYTPVVGTPPGPEVKVYETKEVAVADALAGLDSSKVGSAPTLHELADGSGYAVKGEVGGEDVYYTATVNQQTGAITLGTQIADATIADTSALNPAAVGENATLVNLQGGGFAVKGQIDGADVYHKATVATDGTITVGDEIESTSNADLSTLDPDTVGTGATLVTLQDGGMAVKGQLDGADVYHSVTVAGDGKVTLGAEIETASNADLSTLDTSKVGSDATLHTQKDGSHVVKGTANGADVYYAATVAADGKVTLGAQLNGSPLASIDSALQQVDSLRSELGAIQNRFQSTIANLSNTVNNLSAARSRIEDADYAVEVSNMTRAQILQQAGTSVLAQANQVPQTVLSLLR